MKKLRDLKDAKILDSGQQKLITGGFLPLGRFCCGCITPNSNGILEIIEVDCNSDCPDGSPSVSGLGC